MENTICPNCGFSSPSDANFCLKCGKQLKESASFGLGKQLGVYALSFFLPPFGLWPAIKYLKTNDSQAQKVGIVAIALTVISILISIYFAVSTIATFSQLYSSQGLLMIK